MATQRTASTTLLDVACEEFIAQEQAAQATDDRRKTEAKQNQRERTLAE